MEIGKTYDVVFTTGRYEIEYEDSVKCIKKTPKSYRIERGLVSPIISSYRKICEFLYAVALIHFSVSVFL